MGPRTAALGLVLLLVSPSSLALEERAVTSTERSLSLYVPAVTEGGGTQEGVLSALTLTIRSPGQGQVYVRTEPLAELDLQGAARLAVDAATEVTGADAKAWDFFFTLTTPSSIIGGPSSGGAMATAAAAALMSWPLDPDIAMTGMINPDLSIGAVGGILAKAEAVASVGVETFLIPSGQRTQFRDVITQDDQGREVAVRQTIDVVEHAKREWGLEVVEVDDLYDVLPRFTGNEFRRPTATSDPTRDAAYLDLMAQASRNQGANATHQHEEASVAFNRTTLAADDARTVQAQLARSSSLLTQAVAARNASRHYQASSLFFQSLVETRHALAILDYYESPGDIPGYTRSYVDAAAAATDAAFGLTELPPPWSPNQLGAQAAVEARYREAQRRIADAQAHVAAQRWGAALEAASFAQERLGSTAFWADVRERVGGLGPDRTITEAALVDLADKYRGAASLMLAYAEVVLAAAGADATTLAQARTEISQGDAAKEDDHHAAAVFGMLRAMSLVNAAMGNLNADSSQPGRLALTRERAAYEISLARSQGVEPVYAVSQFEFAESRAAAAPADAYESYAFARMAARVTLEASGHAPTEPTWDAVPVAGAGPPGQRFATGAAWAWLVLGAVPAALGLSVAAALTWGPWARRP